MHYENGGEKEKEKGCLDKQGGQNEEEYIVTSRSLCHCESAVKLATAPTTGDAEDISVEWPIADLQLRSILIRCWHSCPLWCQLSARINNMN